jgi:hypothetical protein
VAELEEEVEALRLRLATLSQLPLLRELMEGQEGGAYTAAGGLLQQFVVLAPTMHAALPSRAMPLWFGANIMRTANVHVLAASLCVLPHNVTCQQQGGVCVV